MRAVATAKAIKTLAALIASVAVLATSAAATPAVMTTTVNLGSGPGAGSRGFGTIQEEGPLDVTESDASEACCTVSSLGRDRFVNGKCISRRKPGSPSWPGSFMTGNGATTCGNGIRVHTPVYKSSNDFIDVNFGAGAVAPPISSTPSASSTAPQSGTPTVPKTSSVARNASQTSNPAPTSSPLPTGGGTVVLGRSFPNETNTGVPDNLKSSLTPYTGPCTITAADVKIDRKVITCDQLRLLGPNAAITNSIINGTVYSDCCYLNGSFSLTDSEVRGPGSTATVIGEARFKLLRVEVSGGSRSVNCNTTCEIRDSYIHGQYGDKRGIDHESGIRQDSHGTFVHNTISCDAIAYPNPNGGEGSGCSAAVSGYGDFGTVNNNRFTDNLIESREGLNGQAASSYCVYGGSTTGKPYPNAHHIVFTDNIFRRGGMGKCGIYGPVTSFDSNAEGSLWQNNLWDDGATVPPAN